MKSTISLVEADNAWIRRDKIPSKYLTQAQSATYFGLKNLLTVGESTDVWGSYSTMRQKGKLQIATVSNQYLWSTQNEVRQVVEPNQMVYLMDLYP